VRSGIILIGGEAKRVSGQEKYYFRYQGKTFIERLIHTLREVTDEIILVARDETQCEKLSAIAGTRCVPDIRRGVGPAGGIHAGATAAHGDLLFIAACDMPCVDSMVVRMLFNAIGSYDAAIPAWNSEMLEPLHAVYRREPLLRYLESNKTGSLREVIRHLNTIFIDVDEIRKYDPGLMTFKNINKPEDLEDIDRC
jgi:molybdopterin-guanine dinucleotide biosynthesis protein A